MVVRKGQTGIECGCQDDVGGRALHRSSRAVFRRVGQHERHFYIAIESQPHPARVALFKAEKRPTGNCGSSQLSEPDTSEDRSTSAGRTRSNIPLSVVLLSLSWSSRSLLL